MPPRFQVWALVPVGVEIPFLGSDDLIPTGQDHSKAETSQQKERHVHVSFSHGTREKFALG